MGAENKGHTLGSQVVLIVRFERINTDSNYMTKKVKMLKKME